MQLREAGHRRDVARQLFAAFSDGTLSPSPMQRFSLADAAQAHGAMESRERMGSLLLVP